MIILQFINEVVSQEFIDASANEAVINKTIQWFWNIYLQNS